MTKNCKFLYLMMYKARYVIKHIQNSTRDYGGNVSSGAAYLIDGKRYLPMLWDADIDYWKQFFKEHLR
jgi:hypothetical protein